MRSLLEANTEWVSIFGKSWDLHATKALGVSLEENLEIVSDTVGFLTQIGQARDLRRGALLRRVEG